MVARTIDSLYIGGSTRPEGVGINYENGSSWFPGSFVFGIDVGEESTIVGGRCSTL
jgi:hypothetical protein